MSRLIAEWHYQQEKCLMCNEWAKGILDGRPIEGIPSERDGLKQTGVEDTQDKPYGACIPQCWRMY